MNKKQIIGMVAAGMFLACGGVFFGAALGDQQESVKWAQDTTTDTTSTATPAEKTSATGTPTFSDGTWLVGEDIPAGRYRTVDTVDGECYWSISNDGDIQDNDFPGGGRPTVTLKKGQEFKSSRCGTWKRSK